jgi:hypothetical protein
LGEPVELSFPELAVELHPGGRAAQRLRHEPAAPHPALPTDRRQAGARQHLEVLRDGGEAHGERPSQVADGGLTPGEAREDGATRRVREGGEGAIEGSVIVNHMV